VKTPRVERFSRDLPPEKRAAVRAASSAKTQARRQALASFFEDAEDARAQAAEIKSYVLDNLRELLLELEEACTRNGIQVHWAFDASAACQIVSDICQVASLEGGVVVKGKSMATEEIHLNAALADAGFEVVETDLGEYVVQIDGDTPSHIVTPIIHKNRQEIARSFVREGLGPYTEDPAELTGQARTRLRTVFQQASVGISGVNFAVAESGRLVIVENEGNNRLTTTAPRVHVAVMGIEKVIPNDSHLPILLRLLAASATGQQITTYTHIIQGPRREGELDGPDEVHLVLLDNGRSRVLQGPYRDILRCIRCGACLNVCPVYRQVSGHGYRHVYPGPLGAVLAPALEGVENMGDLAKASSLCGACEEVCPVKIPIPDLLLRLREEADRNGVDRTIPWKWFGMAAANAARWRTGLRLLPIVSSVPLPLSNPWREQREQPSRIGRDFRRWWNDRSR
jgi:L-lactate dehydrogenase complex protein LldF